VTLERIGLIDLGSHSARLLVVEADGRRWRVVDEERAILRLGDALAQEGRLVGELERAQSVYRLLCRRSRQLGAARPETVGTAALRAARDGAAFAARLARAAGVPITVLDGEEEARLGFLGAVASLDVEAGYLVDLGGASTEISRFADRRLEQAGSVDLGAVTLHQRLLQGDPPAAEQVEAAKNHVRERIREILPEPQRGMPLVALGGSFRSIAKLHQEAERYPFPSLHGYLMPTSAVAQLWRRVHGLALRDRLKVPGLAVHRAELAPSALLIAAAIVEHLAPSGIVISGTGLREGLLYRRLGVEVPPPARELLPESAENLLFQLGEVPEPMQVEVGDRLTEALAPLLRDAPRGFARSVVRLRGIGRRINFYERNHRTFDIVVGARMFGLSHREQVLLAAAAAYDGPRRTRELLRPYLDLLERGDTVLVQRVGLAAAYAEALVRSAPGVRWELAAEIGPALITLGLAGGDPPPSLPFGESERLAAQFPKVFGRKLTVRYS